MVCMIRIVLVGVILISFSNGSLRAEDDDAAAGLYGEFLQIADAVQTHALAPPTRQEMLMRAIRATTSNAPADLAQQISDAGSREMEQKILAQSLAGVKWTESMRSKFLTSAAQWTKSVVSVKSISDVGVTRQLRANLYVGIGIQISKTGEYAVMQKVFPRGPARKAKAKDGDQIIKVDGVDLSGVGLGDVVSRLRGKRGTKVTVTLKTSDEPPRDVQMVRSVVPIDSVEGVARRADDSWDFQTKQNKDIALIRIVDLKGSTISELRDAAQRIKRNGAKAVIIDLTRVSGGEFRHAVMLADALIGEAELGSQTKRTGTVQYTSDSGSVFEGLPIVAMIGKVTTGATEWLAAALGDSGRAPLIGSRTGGSGAITTEVDLDSGFVVQIVSGMMVRSNGKPIQNANIDVANRFARIAGEAIPYFQQSSRKASGGVEPDFTALPSDPLGAAIKLLQKSHLK